MVKPKDLVVKPITAQSANAFIKRHHYSGKVVANSTLHLGVFVGKGKLLKGVMQFGHCLNKQAMIGLVEGTGWNEFIELNRMAFIDELPKNSESRCIGVALRMIRKNYKHIKWVVSFSDGTQCGDGTIYRASGFLLTGIKKNTGLRKNPETGEVLQAISAHHKKMRTEWQSWDALEGYQLRYIYFLDKDCLQNLTVPVLPFSIIADKGATMYKGQACKSGSPKAPL